MCNNLIVLQLLQFYPNMVHCMLAMQQYKIVSDFGSDQSDVSYRWPL